MDSLRNGDLSTKVRGRVVIMRQMFPMRSPPRTPLGTESSETMPHREPTTKSRFLVLCAWCVCAVTLAMTAPVHAGDSLPREPTARAEWLSSRAESAFSEGRFNDAIRLYLDAWEAVPSANILYNVAFIYDRRLSDPELASQYYERAASSPDADATLIQKARARIAAIKAEALVKPPKDPPPSDPPPRDPPPAPGPSSPLKLGPILVMGGGGVLLVGGIAMGFVASSTEDDFQAAPTAAAKRDLQSTGKTQALVADILMVTGVLAAAGGFVWYLFDEGGAGESRVESVSGGLRIEPLFIPGGAGLILGGSL